MNFKLLLRNNSWKDVAQYIYRTVGLALPKASSKLNFDQSVHIILLSGILTSPSSCFNTESSSFQAIFTFLMTMIKHTLFPQTCDNKTNRIQISLHFSKVLSNWKHRLYPNILAIITDKRHLYFYVTSVREEKKFCRCRAFLCRTNVN